MDKAQAFFVVGHAKWGKSYTLGALTGGVHQIRSATIGNRTFLIRRMSNDDDPEMWTRRVSQLNPKKHTHVILTVCPTSAAQAVLAGLRDRYDLFFWIIRQSYSDSRVILAAEEQALRLLGTVEVLSNRVDAAVRAAAFEHFISAHP